MKRYDQHRQSIMLSRKEGLTKTYNRFHDPQGMTKDIVQTADDVAEKNAVHSQPMAIHTDSRF